MDKIDQIKSKTSTWILLEIENLHLFLGKLTTEFTIIFKTEFSNFYISDSFMVKMYSRPFTKKIWPNVF